MIITNKKTSKKNRFSEGEALIIKQEKERKAFNEKLYDLVYNYPTRNKEGFVNEEQQILIAMFPKMNMDKYWDAQSHITCMMEEKTGQFIIYHCDVLTALRCGLENRDMHAHEWD